MKQTDIDEGRRNQCVIRRCRTLSRHAASLLRPATQDFCSYTRGATLTYHCALFCGRSREGFGFHFKDKRIHGTAEAPHSIEDFPSLPAALRNLERNGQRLELPYQTFERVFPLAHNADKLSPVLT